MKRMESESKEIKQKQWGGSRMSKSHCIIELKQMFCVFPDKSDTSTRF